MKVSIIIPTYNERENLPILLEKIFRVFKENSIDGEVVVVDDASPDNTGKVADRLVKRYKNIRVLHRETKSGLSSAVLDGIEIAKGDIIGVMDADLSHPPEEIPRFLKAMKKADFAIGSRYKKGSRIEDWNLKRKIISRSAKLLAKPLTNISDPLSGFLFFRKNLIKGIKLDPKGFKIGLEILVKARPKKIVEIPHTFIGRKKGESKLKAVEYLNYLHHIISLYFLKIEQFLKFCVVGSLGTITNLLILYGLTEFANIWYIFSAVVAFVIAATQNFILNKIWTFKDRRNGKAFVAKQWTKFFTISILSLGINLIVLYTLVEFFGVWYIFAQILATLVALSVNFLGNKTWTFI